MPSHTETGELQETHAIFLYLRHLRHAEGHMLPDSSRSSRSNCGHEKSPNCTPFVLFEGLVALHDKAPWLHGLRQHPVQVKSVELFKRSKSTSPVQGKTAQLEF